MQRKIFRIEQMAGERSAHAPSVRPAFPRRRGADAIDAQSPGHELDSIRETLAETMRTLSTLLHDGKERRMTRAAGELGAAVEAMEKATNKILQSAEAIDECAKALAAARKTDYEAGLAHDIQDHIVSIYEACNFQDLVGQRIGKVIGTLGLVEGGVAGLLARTNGGEAPVHAAVAPGHELLNGPRLDGDSGHVAQRDIDALFG